MIEARLDYDRTKRIGMPEAVFCQDKTPLQCLTIVEELLANGSDTVIASRATAEQSQLLNELSPQACDQQTFTWRHRPPTKQTAAVIAAGTSDLPVASECKLVLEALGHAALSFTDVGVAGLHRLLQILPELEQAEVVVAIAGMEGALATVLGGLIPQPIIAVPTSVGYGNSHQGQTALNAMLASCSPGICVVGIDNGFGAGCAAHRLLANRQLSHQALSNRSTGPQA